MMWKDYLRGLSEVCMFQKAATEIELLSIKKGLHVDLPKKLIDLYHETNGVFGQYNIPFIWSTNQMVKENMIVWNVAELENDKKTANLLFFSDAGNGDLFGYSLSLGKVQSEDIYVWNHEDGSKRVIVSSLEEFLKGWISGDISV